MRVVEGRASGERVDLAIYAGEHVERNRDTVGGVGHLVEGILEKLLSFGLEG